MLLDNVALALTWIKGKFDLNRSRIPKFGRVSFGIVELREGSPDSPIIGEQIGCWPPPGLPA